MRINEKHLAFFAVSNSPSEKEGWLLKRGEVNKAFQKRWFVIKGNLLFYFERKTDKEPIGVIILEGCTVELAENAENYTFELVFQGSASRTYVLAAESQEEMEAWMKAIASSNYEYIRLMVSELQRQLDDLNNQSTSAAPWNKSSSKTKHLSKQQPLLDLSVPTATPPGTRKNPFNGAVNEGSSVDLFGATPFQVDGKQQARSFEEMHEEFGYYIQQMQEKKRGTQAAAKEPDHPLIDFSDLILSTK